MDEPYLANTLLLPPGLVFSGLSQLEHLIKLSRGVNTAIIKELLQNVARSQHQPSQGAKTPQHAATSI